MRSRLRVVSFTVQVNAVADDGEHLTPVPIEPVQIPAAEWDQWVARGLPVALRVAEAQLNGETPDLDDA